MPSRSQSKRWRSLQRRKGRQRHGLFLAEGPHLVDELLGASLGIRDVIYTARGRNDREIARLLRACRDRGVPIEEVDERELAEYADTVTPQGILAVAEIPGSGWDRLPDGDLLVCDGIQDPGNLGTILRTAEALGVAGTVSLKGTVDPWNPKTVRASAGSVFRVPVVDADWEETSDELRRRGLPLWASGVDGDALDREDPVPERVAVVLGNEGAGVRPEILASADRRVAIRLRGSVESLNVAVAAALLMDRIFSARRS